MTTIESVGLCDEHDLTPINFAFQARLRLSHDLEASMTLLQHAAGPHGFGSLHTPIDVS